MRRIGILAAIVLGCSVVVALVPAAGAQSPPTCDGRTATIWGDEGNNRLVGTSGPDVIHGLGGRDRIFGGGGGDIICGGEGSDLIKGEKGRDRLFGNEGRDRVIGGQGADFVDGGRGDDRVSGGFGDDTILAGPGDDRVQGAAGVDLCDFDRKDTYETCEEGDVAGLSGLGSGTFPLDVPAEFAFSTFDFQGGVADTWVLHVFIASSGGTRDYSLDVLDRFGDVQFSDGATVTVDFQEFVMATTSPPTTLVIDGLEPDDFWDIAVFKPQNLQQVDPDGGLFGSDNAVFRWKGGVPAGRTASLLFGPTIPGSPVDGFVVGYTPGQAPEVIFNLVGVVEETRFEIGATAGVSIYYLFGIGADWTITRESG